MEKGQCFRHNSSFSDRPGEGVARNGGEEEQEGNTPELPDQVIAVRLPECSREGEGREEGHAPSEQGGTERERQSRANPSPLVPGCLGPQAGPTSSPPPQPIPPMAIACQLS